ncbi:hypothetical protein D3C71_2040680 [compost metagenome]
MRLPLTDFSGSFASNEKETLFCSSGLNKAKSFARVSLILSLRTVPFFSLIMRLGDISSFSLLTRSPFSGSMPPPCLVKSSFNALM